MFSTRRAENILPQWGRTVQKDRLAAVLQNVEEKSKILDLGSGRGAYVKDLALRGFKPYGLDMNYYPEWRIEDEKLSFLVGRGTHLPFVNKAFDATIAFEVFEHIPNPVQALKEVARCTKNLFIFSVPNCDLNNALRRYDLAMAHWTDPTHCNYFTKESLRNFLVENRFKIVNMVDCYRVSPNDYYWNTVKLPRRITALIGRIMDRFNLVETYWSSILVVAEVPKDF